MCVTDLPMSDQDHLSGGDEINRGAQPFNEEPLQGPVPSPQMEANNNGAFEDVLWAQRRLYWIENGCWRHDPHHVEIG